MLSIWTNDLTIQLVVHPFPNKPWFLPVCSRSLLKTLLEKEKLLIMRKFSFSHSVLNLFGELSAIFIKFEIVACKVFQFERVKNLSFGKRVHFMDSKLCDVMLGNNSSW